MTFRKDVYITIEWQEQGPMDATGQQLQKKGREVSSQNYPETLPCHNPNCKDGGFKIGEKIVALLASEEYHEQNSLVCKNAIHPDRTKRCFHTIFYSISCIYPHGRRKSRSIIPDLNSS